MQTFLKINFIIFLIIIFWSCAKQSSTGPTGGPKDETPPELIEASPPNKSVNFSGNMFEITFDEYFVLDKVDQKLMISPPFKNKPEIKTKNKSLIVSFEDELIDSTTYAFNFLDAIRDLNENNPIENFQYVFSTGSEIDSLSLTGKVVDALSLKPEKDVFVSLYKGTHDTLPQKTIPQYITRVSEDGSFRIDNITKGKYSAYSLIDLNGNLYYDLPDEKFAFLDTLINISPENNFIPSMPDSLATAADSAKYLSIPGIEPSLHLFTAQNTEQYLTSTDRLEAYKLQYFFKLPVEMNQFKVEFPEIGEVDYLQQLSPKRDSITLWLKDSLIYSAQTINALTSYPETDSLGNIVLVNDTISFRFIAPRQVRGKNKTKESALKISHNIPRGEGLNPKQNIVFKSNIPLHKINKSKMSLFMMKDSIKMAMDFQLNNDSTNKNSVALQHKFIEDSTYILTWDKGVFEDIYGKQNDSLGVKFRIRSKDSFGNLTIRLSDFSNNIIIQLISKDGKLVREKHISSSDKPEVFFNLLEKGKYRLKAIYDTNGDGVWTTGSYDEKRQPEPVTYFHDIIEIKVQWDLVQDWSLSKKHIESPNPKEEIIDY